MLRSLLQRTTFIIYNEDNMWMGRKMVACMKEEEKASFKTNIYNEVEIS
jgi:hypothetical protein